MRTPATDLQQSFIDDVRRAVQGDDRIRAAWLEGSFGRGDADAYSDVDLHLLLDPSHETGFRAGAEQWLTAIRRLVLYRLLFDGRMINAMTDDALRIDLWLHAGASTGVRRDRIVALKEAPGVLQSQPALRAEAAPPERLGATITEFWRCIAMMPVFIGRDERLVGLMGLNVEQGLAVDILCDGYGIVRDAGVKKLNPFLPVDLRHELEAALDLQGLTIAGLAAAHLRLAALIKHHGRVVAARHHIPYPGAVEDTAITTVRNCLADLALDQLLRLGTDCRLFDK